MKSNFVKAKLLCQDGAEDLNFMFNPSELAFESIVETADNPGARSDSSGKPMVSFSNIKAYKVTIANIVFDTYETGDDVVVKYIEAFREAVKFVQGLDRPPLYTFIWGAKVHLKLCFVERLNYKLTKFMADGTPVRAVIESLTLKETDGIEPEKSALPKSEANPIKDNIGKRLKGL